ncbi:hypothetical protein [Actinoplanes sp. NPDC051851]|uniref:hypothetical protein n=1 Tax=Actinoplanes sp. NPDC051851 TaxID=3154753 RepID=UPI003419B56B
MAAQSEWTGLAQGRSDAFDDLEVVAPSAANAGWSSPFRALATDYQQYFVKCLEACPSGQGAAIAVELVVAEVGRLIDAPVCTTSLIRIPEGLDMEIRPGVNLSPGLAHASLALRNADERGRPRLSSRTRDDNRRRHVGIYALYDWCFGADPQWLYDLNRDHTIYSHDHGLYFPPADHGFWTRADLEAAADLPHELPDPRGGLDSEQVTLVASKLEAVTQSQLAAIMQSVPSSWPVSDDDLEALGWFLEHRAPAVAERLRAS